MVHFSGCAICCFTVIDTINRSNASEQEAQLKFEQNQANFEQERYNTQPIDYVTFHNPRSLPYIPLNNVVITNQQNLIFINFQKQGRYYGISNTSRPSALQNAQTKFATTYFGRGAEQSRATIHGTTNTTWYDHSCDSH